MPSALGFFSTVILSDLGLSPPLFSALSDGGLPPPPPPPPPPPSLSRRAPVRLLTFRVPLPSTLVRRGASVSGDVLSVEAPFVGLPFSSGFLLPPRASLSDFPASSVLGVAVESVSTTVVDHSSPSFAAVSFAAAALSAAASVAAVAVAAASAASRSSPEGGGFAGGTRWLLPRRSQSPNAFCGSIL